MESFERVTTHDCVKSSVDISETVSLSLSSLTLALVSLYKASVIQNGVLEMTEIQTLDLQQNDVTELQGLWDPIIHIESQLTQDDLIREIAKRLSEFLLSRGIFEQFCKTLPSFGPPRHPKRSHRRDKSGRKSLATEVGSISSMHDACVDDRNPLCPKSVETCSSDAHPKLYVPTAGSRKKEESFGGSVNRYAHLDFLARLDNIRHMKNDPRTLLGKLRPIDVVQLRGCGLEKLLDFRYRYNISDEILFQYYEGARSLNHANHIPTLPKSRMFREDRTQMNTHETPQQRVLERLQRTSEQATEAAIESRYYKLTLYCQIKNIEEKLYDSGKSTSGVGFRTKAFREWINRTRCSELQEDDVKSWRDEGEKWKKLCDKFTPGILEVSHEALDAR